MERCRRKGDYATFENEAGLSAIVLSGGLVSCSSTHPGDGRTAGRVVDDNRITTQVERELNSEPVYKFSEVDVKTFEGMVQLSGLVLTEDQKRRAGEIAQRTPGVAQVANNIVVRPTSGLTPTGRTNSAPMDVNQQQPQQQQTNP